MVNTGSSPNVSLSDSVASDLRRRLSDGEWGAGETLASEHSLASTYGVSRATIRTALQDLESRGLTMTRHGLGTLVMASGRQDQSDIRRLESMTSAVIAQGREPATKYRSILVREVSKEEATALQIPSESEVLATERTIWADGELLGFSSEIIPLAVLGADFDLGQVKGSLFDLLDSMGVQAVVAITELGADHGPEIGWGDRPADASYLRLNQLHYDHAGRPVVSAITHFIDGRFNFGLVRHR